MLDVMFVKIYLFVKEMFSDVMAGVYHASAHHLIIV